MTYRYEYVGDSARSIPALALEVVPGQQVEVEDEIRLPDFVAIGAETGDAGETRRGRRKEE